MPFVTEGWPSFCVAFGLMLLTTLIMSVQGMYLYTKDVVIRKFGIMDLQLASSPQEVFNIIKGMYELPEAQSKKALRALKGQLYVDFFFMPAVYGGIFLLCMEVSSKMEYAGKNFFIALAWLQLIPWLCDIIENIHLLTKIRPQPVLSKPSTHKVYLVLQAVKWGIALISAVCAFSAIFYFWLAGLYSYHSLRYVLIIIAEIILFIVAAKIISKKFKKKEKTLT